MAFRMRLADEDRERLGVPEEIVADFAKIGQVDAEYLDELRAQHPGKDYPDPENLISWLRGTPVLNDDGSPVLDDEDKPRTRIPVRGMRLLVWVALRQAGKEIEFDGFDFARAGVRFVDDPKEPETSAPSESPSEA